MSDRVTRYLCILIWVIVAFVLLGIIDTLFSSGRSSSNAIRNSETRSVEISIITALKAYRTDYGHFPAVRSDGRYETAEDNAKLMRALCGLDTTDNTRKVVYFENRAVKQPTHPRYGFDAKGTLWDPWGNFYRIRIDADEDGKIENPYKNTHQPLIAADVIVWALGKDGVQSESDDAKNSWGNLPDDVLSWRN